MCLANQLVQIDPCVNVMEKKNSKLILALCLAVCVGFAASEILKSDPLVRLIPADVLRGEMQFVSIYYTVPLCLKILKKILFCRR